MACFGKFWLMLMQCYPFGIGGDVVIDLRVWKHLISRRGEESSQSQAECQWLSNGHPHTKFLLTKQKKGRRWCQNGESELPPSTIEEGLCFYLGEGVVVLLSAGDVCRKPFGTLEHSTSRALKNKPRQPGRSENKVKPRYVIRAGFSYDKNLTNEWSF